jgi:peptidoglycan/xylan/chitin deacetylase (PgdA/CDA1 family)
MKYFKFFNIFLLCFIFASLFVSVANADNSKKNGYYINKNFDLIPNDKAMNKKVVLITIDDGPGKTDRDLINTLKKHNAKAIFFINGIHDKDYKSNIKMLFDEGFSIGNHTWSHANLKKSKEDTIKKEIDDNTKLIVKLTGQNPRFFRPPYGAINTFTKNLVKKEGMLFMNWSGAAKDWEKNTKDEKVFSKNDCREKDFALMLLTEVEKLTENLAG